MVYKEEYEDWKMHPVTQRLLRDLKEDLAELAEELTRTAGINPPNDIRNVGRCDAIRGILDWVPVEVRSFTEEDPYVNSLRASSAH
jgi:hypothetical protein